jgi:hypothetical protein
MEHADGTWTPDCGCDNTGPCFEHRLYFEAGEVELGHINLLLDLPQYAHLKDSEELATVAAHVYDGITDADTEQHVAELVKLREWILAHGENTE